MFDSGSQVTPDCCNLVPKLFDRAFVQLAGRQYNIHGIAPDKPLICNKVISLELYDKRHKCMAILTPVIVEGLSGWTLGQPLDPPLWLTEAKVRTWLTHSVFDAPTQERNQTLSLKSLGSSRC